jgi:hypothetical protein
MIELVMGYGESKERYVKHLSIEPTLLSYARDAAGIGQ